MRIWKWTLEITGEQTLLLPAGAKLLDVQMQNGDCCLWAICDEKAEKAPRHIAIYGTGHPIQDDPGEYIATFQVYNGALVYHVFETYS